MNPSSDLRVLRGPQRERVAAALAERFDPERVPIRELASKINRRPSMVRRLLDEAGVHAEGAPCVGITESEVAAALATRYREGAPIDRLSRDTGIDRRVVRRLLIEAKVPLRERRPPPPNQTDWVVEQYRAGATLRKLAELTGCSYSTIRRILVLAGVALRSPGTRSTRGRKTR